MDEPQGFADLHAHAAIPVLGAWWRRHVQGFALPALDGDVPVRAPEPDAPLRLNVLSLHETFLVRPAAARARVLVAARAYGSRTLPGGARLITRAVDLRAGYLQGYLLAVESLRHTADPGALRILWDLGVRSLQPIHFLDTSWGRSSLEGLLPPSRRGLSALGREMLAEMDRLGFILDLAHMNDPTAEASLAAYRGPVMCSHTGLREIRESQRNIPAELAREILRRGGAVGVTCWLRLLGPLRSGAGGFRGAWTRAFCETVAAFGALSPGARVSAGSDRGAPIRVPPWVFSPGHLAEVDAGLERRGWDAGARRAFRWNNARDFLAAALPP
jgi:microsomal dipeptidase-like Zn-dependent dipeptidase